MNLNRKPSGSALKVTAVCGLLLNLFGCAVDQAGPVLHPNRPDRLVVTRDGFSIEYSEGQEAYVEAALAELVRWQDKVNEKLHSLKMVAGDDDTSLFEELRNRQAEILQSIASAIGITEPTDQMEKAYQKVVEWFEILATILKGKQAEGFAEALMPRQVVVWEEERLNERLKAGEMINPFTYDSETDGYSYSYRFKANKTQEAESLVLPILINEEYEDMTPQELVRGFFDGVLGNIFKMLEDFPQMIGEDLGAVCLHVAIHEAAEVGLVFSYMVSPDRRSAMDGMAEYVTWRVVRDMNGLERANKVYPLESQIKKYEALQSQVDLVNWAAAESQDPEENGTDLNKARYPFSALAFFLIADRYGDAALTRLWKKVGQTSRNRANLGTVNDACKWATGRDLYEFYEEVETVPLNQLVGGLEILRSHPVPPPEPEFLELTVEGIPIRIDHRITIPKGFLAEAIAKLKAKLRQSLVASRFYDELKDPAKLTEVHLLIKSWNRRRVVLKPDVAKYLEITQRMAPGKPDSEIVFRGIEIWDHEAAFAALRAGEIFQTISFGEEYGDLKRNKIPMGIGRYSIRLRKWVIPVMGPDYDLTILTTAFQDLEQQFDSVLDQFSKQVAANYITYLTMAASRRYFSYFGNDQRWFHEGFALYLAYALLIHLIGAEENKQVWSRYFSFDNHMSLSEETFFNWDDQAVPVQRLRAFSQWYFLRLHIKYGHETVGNWLNALEKNQQEIKDGAKTVRSILEDLIGESGAATGQSQN